MNEIQLKLWVLIVAALAVAGCGALADIDSAAPTTTADVDSDRDSSTTTSTTVVPFGSTDDLNSIAGRIIVSTADGGLEVLTLDGKRRSLINSCLTAPVPVSLGRNQGCQTQLFTQPTWSPDSSSVAATVVSADDQNAITVINVDDPTDRAVTKTSQPPYFYNWSDDGETLLTLGPGREGTVVLNRANGRGTVLDTITEAVPIFVDWEPNGNDLAVHEGADLNTHQLESDAIDGFVKVNGVTLGNSFRTPVFLPQSRVALAVLDNDLAKVDLDTGAIETVVPLVPSSTSEPWQFQMVATNDGTKVAVLGFSPTGETRTEVIELETKQRRAVSDRPALWMEWNPQGTHLLLLNTVDGFAQWQLWTEADGLLDSGTAVQPSTTELSGYLPFFDQYVASVHRWSPDGRAFVFTGIVDDREEVWIQPVDPWTRPVPMGEGLVAWWSPT